MRRMLIVFVGAVIFQALLGLLLWQDFARFIGTKALPLPQVAAVDRPHFEELMHTTVGVFFGGRKTQMTLGELNAMVATMAKEGKLAKSPVYLADGKGNLVVLISAPVGGKKYANAVLLFAPEQGKAAAGRGLQPIKLTKVMANGKELDTAQTTRLKRLLRMTYRHLLDAMLERGHTFPKYLSPNTVPTEPLKVGYENQTLYFNGYKP